MSESILDHGYVPEEHAPDPVAGHGDPTPPGKIAIWLFLASEIMFFIAILGTYIILRSGSPDLFAKHAAILSKTAAGINTVVLIFSSLTMALAVDASQKGDRKRTVVCLALTLACAFGFMCIKAYEYSDKIGWQWAGAHGSLGHHTFVAKGDSPLTVKAPAGSQLYAVVSVGAGDDRTVFNGTDFVKPPEKSDANPEAKFDPAAWKGMAVELKDLGNGTYAAAVPGAAAGASAVDVYRKQTSEAAPTDEKVLSADLAKPGGDVTYRPVAYVYDGHVHDEKGVWKVHGYRMELPEHGPFDIHLVSEHDVKTRGGQKEEAAFEVPVGYVTNDQIYAPNKSLFYSSYFTLTGVHGLHVIGGMIPLSILLVQAMRGKLLAGPTEYTGLYWHFVDLVWIFLFPLLYLI